MIKGIILDRLVNQVAVGETRKQGIEHALTLKKRVQIDDPWVLADLELLTTGAYTPLNGFMTGGAYETVVDHMCLYTGATWALPVVLPVNDYSDVKDGQQIALFQGDIPLAVVLATDKFKRDKEKEAKEVYRTNDSKHPGVAHLMKQSDYCIGGAVTLLNLPQPRPFVEYRLTPEQTRAEFAKRGWKRVVGFQTRNPVHRAHEYIQKCALEICDGLLLHPLVGDTKPGDMPADVRMWSYEKLVELAYPKNRVLLSVFPAAMRYAGPREAIYHAQVRKNYGCTHFIVGRDHAGVGSYYGSYDAQHIFEGLDLGITPLFFENAAYCQKCLQVVTSKTCPHSEADWLILSGTTVRDLLKQGSYVPVEFTRPEIAELLRNEA